MLRHCEGLKRVGDLAILSHDTTTAQDQTGMSLWEPYPHPNHKTMMLVIHAGIAPDALHSLISIASYKPRASPYVKPPRRSTCPAARFKPGACIKAVLTNILPSWPFSTVPRVLPSYIVWCSGYTWCVPKSVPVAFGWFASS